ncbi:hypothetical protein [Citricoccus sp. NR2]|uniref:hypothetical protein n=1 Tax=Citricoccus sp. NR2 TaxID=3004095 RepID=UPI0022DD5012|nr:hypothetical protein [Citricoccus sp. NR2]WBL18523.1 hypothetical protein O1A05_12250 [Citricoccus sp. NR2]
MSDRAVWALDTPGVRHAAADARALTYVATGGVSGLVASGGGGLVRTPGDSTSVRILPCSVVAVSRYPGHVNQSYSFRVPSAVDVQIRAAGSGGGRTDAVILRVRDRAVSGETIPEDPNSVDYWEPQVLEGVPSSTGYTEDGIAAWRSITYPFVLLGIVNVAANQSAINTVDVLAWPIAARKDTHQQILNVVARDHIGQNTAFQDIGPRLYFDVPPWATHATITAIVMGAYNSGVSSSGLLSGLSMGQSLQQTNWDIDINTNAQSGIYVRSTLVVTGEVNVSAARRGTVQDFRLRATNNGTGSNFGINSGSAVHLRVDFEENIDLGW